MSTPLTPDQAAAHLDRLSFGERRALRRADYRVKGLKKIAATPYGASLVESVLAVHTTVLGRPATDLDAARAATALSQPGVRRTTLQNTAAPAHISVSERSKYGRELQDRTDAALAEADDAGQTGDTP